MKMGKRMLTCALALAMLLGCVPAGAAGAAAAAGSTKLVGLAEEVGLWPLAGGEEGGVGEGGASRSLSMPGVKSGRGGQHKADCVYV